MKNDNMGFGEKWYWANFIRGTNPITTFISGLLFNLWIPIAASMVFCFLTDPQWAHTEGMSGWSMAGYFGYWLHCWYGIFSITYHTIILYWHYFWDHMGEVGKLFRSIFWLDHPEYFDNVTSH